MHTLYALFDICHFNTEICHNKSGHEQAEKYRVILYHDIEYRKGVSVMGKHLDPLQKEFLIRRFRDNPEAKISDFCEANNVSVGAFKNWLKQYEQIDIIFPRLFPPFPLYY